MASYRQDSVYVIWGSRGFRHNRHFFRYEDIVDWVLIGKEMSTVIVSLQKSFKLVDSSAVSAMEWVVKMVVR